ncbi:MAG: flagellar motor switch protein FliN [Terracidiphilus sp.]|jgi:flagellar motor switch protein FliN/FliY
MANQAANVDRPTFSSAFFDALGNAMTIASGSPWLISALPDDESETDRSELMWIKLALSGSLQGAFLLEFCRSDAALLASNFLSQPVDEFEAEHAEALLKIVKASLNEFRSALEEEYGAFTVKASLSTEPPADRSNIARMTAADGESNRITILMVLNPALAQALYRHAFPDSDAATVAHAIQAARGKAMPQHENLNLVMDVELNVTLRFGQRKLTLREVLDLTSGSVVELDRQVEEPVELLLDGVVIARGEAVVIDGNYGLRVTEVSRAVTAPVLH